MSNEATFGQRVKERRRELGLTQDELARRVGCAPVTLRKIEYDDLRPSVQISERLAMALAIPLEERAAFVRLARVERAPLVEPMPTPSPRPEEIGQEDLTGRAIRGYALGERIGAGGFGAVYRAMQPLVEREVAIKIVLPKYANHPDFIRRFEAEAQLVARLEHPHIVPLYDYWREPGVAYLVMRLLRGGSVQAILQNGPLPMELVLRMLEQIGSALGAAHRAGVIHRDLKPANVLLDEDHNAYLADFGIAKNLSNPNLSDQTQADAIVGSPAYISPEQIRSEFVRPQTDIYALGVMLYELLTGRIPFNGPTPIEIMHQHLSAPLPPLAAHRVGLPGTLDAVIEHATAKDPLERYPDVENLLADLRAAIRGEAVKPEIPTTIEARPLTAADNPYKGLRAFGEGDAADFFGREALTQQLLVRMGEGGDLARFLAVVGPSGSGKSSVVGAGLVPALRRGGLPGSENWYIVELMPGAHPFEELEAALLRVAVNPPETLLAQLREDKRGLLRAGRRCLPDDPNVELVLVIDQFEEVFTLVPAEDEATRAHLLDSLVTAALDERSRVRLVITLRADFTDRPLNYVDFGELVRQRAEFVLPLTPDELEQAIVKPAERVGLTLEPGLVAAITRDVGDQPGGLPLLQYALTELFEKREGRTLTKKAYAEIGGVLGALGRRAEEVFSGLNEAGQEAARQLFLRLVTLGEGTEDMRRRVLRSEIESLADVTPIPRPLPPSASRKALAGEGVSPSPVRASRSERTGEGRGGGIGVVIEAFGRSRLLSFDRDPITRGPTVEVAHEALLREWPRLREWLNESRADVRLQRQLAQAAHEWQNANRDVSFLLTGARLEQFEGWAANTSIALTQDERAFLDASLLERDRLAAEERARQQRELEAARKLAQTERARAESEKQRAEEQVQYVRRVRTRNRVIAAAGAVALVLAVLAGIFGLQSNQNATRAETNLSAAQIANTQSAANAATAQAASILASDERNAALAAQATAEAERQRAETENRVATSRELAAAALSNLNVDPERSILLALRAVATTYDVDNTVQPQAEDALHRAVITSRALLTLSGGHTLSLVAAEYSPDGTRFATGGQDGIAKIWDAETGKELLTLQDTGPGDAVNGLAYSPDGRRVATANDDGTVKVWDAITGREVMTMTGHSDFVVSVAYSPDGTRLLSSSGDNTVKMWDTATGKELFTVSNINGVGVAFSPDGKRFATCDDDNIVRIRDVASGNELVKLSGHTAPVSAIKFSPDGTRVATVSGDNTVGGDNTARVWDAATGAQQLSLNLSGAGLGIAFNPDGKRLATSGFDGTATVWDAFSGKPLLTLFGHTSAIYGVSFSADGTRLATAGRDTTAKVWDLTPSRELLTFTAADPGGSISAVAYSPDGKRLATASTDQTAKVWETSSGKHLLTLSGHSANVNAVIFSPDGMRIATASDDKTAKLWDAATGKGLLTLKGHTRPIIRAAFNADGTRLATASYDNTAKVWDVITGKELLTLSGHTRPLAGIAYSPDGKRLATISRDHTAIVWDAASGRQLLTITTPQRGPSAIAFSPDGHELVVAFADGTFRVFEISPDATQAKELFDLAGHTGFVEAVTFSPDGRRFATASDDNTAKMWDAATGQELLTLLGHTGGVHGIAFSPDGTHLTTAGGDGLVRTYLLRIEDLVTLAKSRLTRTWTTAECQKYLHVEACPTEN